MPPLASMQPLERAVEIAASLMQGFVDRTGLGSERPARRYLWTDAFAVCNCLELARITGEQQYTDLALALVEQVHRELGRQRKDDDRRGWLSGLDEQEGAAHPTRGGLRIGKELPERRPDEPFDEDLEWERDGQYFHYLTKWMHALDQVARSVQDSRFNLWARELAATAHATFLRGQPGRRRMAWKMSTDLARPLVSTMGQHDPLEGFLTCAELDATAARMPGAPGGPMLKRAAAEYRSLLETMDLQTADPLGLGGLLSDALRAAELARIGALDDGPAFVEALLAAAQDGLLRHSRLAEPEEPASHRLAFRELGLAIGLSAIEPLRREVNSGGSFLPRRGLSTRVEEIAEQRALGDQLVSFWLQPEHRRSHTWSDHRDINEVMLATSLVPGGFLDLRGFG